MAFFGRLGLYYSEKLVFTSMNSDFFFWVSLSSKNHGLQRHYFNQSARHHPYCDSHGRVHVGRNFMTFDLQYRHNATVIYERCIYPMHMYLHVSIYIYTFYVIIYSEISSSGQMKLMFKLSFTMFHSRKEVHSVFFH